MIANVVCSCITCKNILFMRETSILLDCPNETGPKYVFELWILRSQIRHDLIPLPLFQLSMHR